MAQRRPSGDYAELRARLRAALRERDVSMRRASLRAGIGPSTLANLLKDTSRQPSTDTCRRLARYFHWPESDVLLWAGHLPAAVDAATRDPLAAISEIIAQSDWDAVRKAWVLKVVEQAAAAAQRTARTTAASFPAGEEWRQWN